METWSLTTNGRILEGFLENDVRTHLSRMGVNGPALEAMLSGKQVTIKKHATIDEIKKLSARFKQCGLQTNPALKLNKACLDAGIQRVEDQSDSPTPSNADSRLEPSQAAAQWETLVFDEKFATPSLIGLPANYETSTTENTRSYRFFNGSYFWQPVPLFICLLIGGVICETYFVRYLSQTLEWRLLATITGLLVLAFCVFILPRLLQPLAFFSIHTQNAEDGINVIEKSVPYLGKRKYLVCNNNSKVAHIERGQANATIGLSEEPVQFHWDKAFTLANIGDDAVEGLQKDMVKGETMSFLSEYLHWFEGIRHMFSKQAKAEDTDWNREDGMVILDQNNTCVAVVYRQPYPALRVHGNIEERRQLLLIAFATTLLRSHLV